jgi:hypothetical protein
MSKKTLALLSIVIAVAIAVAWFVIHNATPPEPATTRDSPEHQAPQPSDRVSPSSTSEQADADARRLNLCGQITNYDPAAGPAIVTVAVALPGTPHPTRTAKLTPDGRWQLSAVPAAPIQIAVTVPGVPATSLYIAEPAPCTDEAYLITLSSAPATTIRGTVSDVFGGPLANAQVEVIPIGHQNGLGFKQPVFRVLTIDDGTFTITVPANEYAVRGTFPGYASKSARADTTAHELAEVALVLDPGAVVSGRVVRSPDGAAVPHAELRLVSLTANGGSSVNHIAPADALSGPDGRFVIENVGAGSWAIYAKTDDAISSTPTEIAIELFADVRDVVVLVEHAPRVSGVVHERNTEQPVPGALVLLQSEPQSFGCAPSDAEGIFDCGAVPPGTYTAIVTHEQYAGNLLGASVQVQADPRYLELEVERGHTIAGRVSPPVAGIPIRARMDIGPDLSDVGYSMMNAFRAAKTDASGRFSIGPLSLGTVTLVAEHAEHGRGEARVDQNLAAAGSEVEIVLSTAGTLIGRVTKLGDTDGTSLELNLTPVEEPMRIDGIRQAGAPMYTIPITRLGDFNAKGLEPGSYALRLQHSRGAVSFTGPEQVELFDDAPTRVELELTGQQQRFAGVVIDNDGSSVEGAVVYLPDDPSTRALADAHGEFGLAAWSDSEALAVRYHRAGYSTAASDASLRAGAHNRLVVPAVSTLEVSHPAVETGRLIIIGQTRMERPASRTGTTTVSGLLAGHYHVHVCGGEGFGHGEVELRERKAQLTIDTQPWIALRGLAIGPEGEPLVGAQILAAPINDPCSVFRTAAMSALAAGPPITDDGGEFTLTGLPTGSILLYFIDVAANPPRELSTTVEVPATTTRHDLGEVRL